MFYLSNIETRKKFNNYYSNTYLWYKQIYKLQLSNLILITKTLCKVDNVHLKDFFISVMEGLLSINRKRKLL